MGKIRQKKKNRSELPKARPKNRGVIKSGRKKVNVLGNAIIAENWLVLNPHSHVYRINAHIDGSIQGPQSNSHSELPSLGSGAPSEHPRRW